jgi:hypothetical protein
MGHRRGERLRTLPPVIHRQQRLTIEQACILRGCGRSKFYEDVASGKLKVQIERDGRYVRVVAGSLLDALEGGA